MSRFNERVWVSALTFGFLLCCMTPRARAVTETAKIQPNIPLQGNGFGMSVALSDRYLVVGAPSMEPDMAYVFERIEGRWIEQAILVPSDAGQIFQNHFGASVAVNGDTIVVGTRNFDGWGRFEGGVYVFRRVGDEWTEQAKLVPSDPDDMVLGASVDFEGDLILASANGRSRAYVFRWNGTEWIEEAKLVRGEPFEFFNAGPYVAIDADTIVVGDASDNDAERLAGAVYVLRHVGNEWIEEAKLTANDADPEDHLGMFVSISGDTIAATAPDDDDLGPDEGAVYVFRRTAGKWIQEAKILAPNGVQLEFFGKGVAIDGDSLVVGDWTDDFAGRFTGNARMYHREGSEWTQVAVLDRSDPAADADFGKAVDIDGTVAVVGANGREFVYIYPVPPYIPAASVWGMIVLALILLAAGSIALRKRELFRVIVS